MKSSVYILFALIISIFFLGISYSFSKSSAESFPNELIFRHEYDLESNRKYYLPIIMYHSTYKKNPGRFNVPPDQLEEDFRWIVENGFETVTFSNLIDFCERGIALPPKPIMLTFDDGYSNNYLYAFPLLKKYNLKCVISVIGFLIDRNYEKKDNPSPSSAHMNYEEIKELHLSQTVEIQNHTYNMHHYGGSRYGIRRKQGESVKEYEERLSKDLKKLDERLITHCGIKTTAVTYPFGAFSKETVPILKKLGYKASLSCCEGINQISKDSSLFNLKRFNRPYGKTSAKYFLEILRKK